MDDPQKVFLGQLRSDVIKPVVLQKLGEFGLEAVDVYVPESKHAGTFKIAFCEFWTPEEAQHCIWSFNGLMDPLLTSSTVLAEEFRCARSK